MLHAVQGRTEKALGVFQGSYIHALLAMRDATLKTLQQEIDFGWPAYLQLLHNPIFESMRTDSEFQKIIEEQKIVYDTQLQKYGQLDY